MSAPVQAWNITFDVATQGAVIESTMVVFGFDLASVLSGFESVRAATLNGSTGIAWSITAARKLSGSEMLALL